MEAQNNKISEIMQTAIEEIKSMVDADTVIGNPIVVGDMTVIPVSKISYGLASGGVDLNNKNSQNKTFGGGGGAGVSVVPVCFIAVRNGEAKILNINYGNDLASKAISLVPDLFDEIKSLFKSKKDTKGE